MPDTRTAVSEIVTGLGLYGFRDLAQALAARPGSSPMSTTTSTTNSTRRSHRALTLMCSGWPGPTGSASPARPMASAAGPLVGGVERPHKPPAYEQIPADLRVDHVYLLSCKYGSKILQNASPANLFDRALNERRTSAVDWFDAVAPTSYGEFYTEVVAHTGLTGLPPDPTELTEIIANNSGRRFPAAGRSNSASSGGSWRSRSRASADRLLDNISAKGEREAFVWRLLRLQAAPYFVLGADLKNVPLHYRVTTPWDFRRASRSDRLTCGASTPANRWFGGGSTCTIGNSTPTESLRGTSKCAGVTASSAVSPRRRSTSIPRITTWLAISRSTTDPDRPKQIGRPVAQQVDERVGHHSARTHASPPA